MIFFCEAEYPTELLFKGKQKGGLFWTAQWVLSSGHTVSQAELAPNGVSRVATSSRSRNIAHTYEHVHEHKQTGSKRLAIHHWNTCNQWLGSDGTLIFCSLWNMTLTIVVHCLWLTSSCNLFNKPELKWIILTRPCWVSKSEN